MSKFNWPLINDNIIEEDKNALVDFIVTPGVRFTQHDNVRNFEKAWSKWLGVKHTTFVNSGASANWVMASALKEKVGVGEIILSPFGWVSDIVPFLESRPSDFQELWKRDKIFVYKILRNPTHY